MQTMEARRNEKNGSVDVIASGKLNTVFVFISLAKQESNTKKDGQEQVERKARGVIFDDIRMRNRNCNTGRKK